MRKENVIGKPSIMRRVLRALLFATGFVAVSLALAHVIWKYSGSSEWKQEIDRNGVKVYSLKAPGSTLKQFRAVTRVKTTLNHSIGPMVMTDLATCAEWVPGCNSMTLIEPWNARAMRSEWMWDIDFGAPFSRREFLLKTLVTADRQRKVVQVDNVAYPDELPRNACCFRVVNMHNTWRYTSLGDGEVQVEMVERMDAGLPYFMFNRQGGEGMYQLFSNLPVLLNDAKYKNAKFDFIDEMASSKVSP
jgi:hypothetical protein